MVQSSKGPILLGMSGGYTGLNWIELGREAVDGPGAIFFTACGPMELTQSGKEIPWMV